MLANTSGWIRRKTARVTLLWVTAGLAAVTLPSGAHAMSVPTNALNVGADAGFSIVFDLDFVDNVLRVTLPKTGDGILDGSIGSGDVLTLIHPLDVLDQVAIDVVPGRGLRVRFDSGPLDSGGSGPGTGQGPGGSVPEPASGGLVALGLLGAAWARRRHSS